MKIKSVCLFVTILTVISRLTCLIAIPATHSSVPPISIAFAVILIVYGSYLITAMRFRTVRTIRFLPYFLLGVLFVSANIIICRSRYRIYFNIYEQGVMGGILDIFIYTVLLILIIAAHWNRKMINKEQNNL